ncbi:hypothetical protein FRX94_08425 [Corynebacterium canis]|uniref:Uncharacterized protein n=1 Tax=Corynebacterium canis TaxID=679663 RepID=A0A5C5UF80_9CORY|nr:hypothetical protein [Corynebacterium canis]TWT24477.1 hypothetical protein FRX94_08425 [Corynebacterium canis]
MADVSNLPDLGFSRANDPKKSTTTTKSSASSPALVGNLFSFVQAVIAPQAVHFGGGREAPYLAIFTPLLGYF